MYKTIKTLFFTCGIGLAAFSSQASAVMLNPNGLGQVLEYPYYTVNAGNSTMLSIVNTTAHGKALRIYFREAYDGREVLGFNLYLSPFDTWVAQVVALADGAAISSPDATCTVPPVPKTAATAHPFATSDFDGSDSPVPVDGGIEDISRTREGHFEVIEMGEVTNATHGSLTAITHVNGVTPGCNAINAAWGATGYWSVDPKTDLAPPGGGLYGSESIINPEQGTMWTINATAIDGFSATVLHTAPPLETPDLNSANDSSTATTVTAMVPVNGKMLAAKYTRATDAISALFMAENLYNEYITAATIGAQSDWVVTFPTKRFYVDPRYGSSLPGASNAQPFDVRFGSDESLPGTSCSEAEVSVFNRDETTLAPLASGAKPQLCFETSVLTFNTSHSVFGSHLISPTSAGPVLPRSTISTGAFTSGHAIMNFDSVAHQLTPATSGEVFLGLPAIGFFAVNYVNVGVSPGVLANYSSASVHRASVKCAKGSSAACE